MVFRTTIGDISRTIPFFSLSQMISNFLGCHVIVETIETDPKHEVKGKLLHYSLGKEEGHIPDTLVIETREGHGGKQQMF